MKSARLENRPVTHRSTRSRIARLLPAALTATAFAATALTLAASAGCQGDGTAKYEGDEPVGGVIFTPDGQTRSVDRFVEVQTAAAARTDATLRPYDFDGVELNSLGQKKIDLMTRDDRAYNPLVVYLDVPEDTDLDARRTTVMVCLKDHGLKDEQIKIEAGPNPAPSSLHPAAQPMKTMHLLDAGAPIGVNPEPAGSPGAK